MCIEVHSVHKEWILNWNKLTLLTDMKVFNRIYYWKSVILMSGHSYLIMIINVKV